MTTDPWRPIAEAPRDGTRVLGYFPNIEAGYHDTAYLGRFETWASRDWPAQPTHWMPLPSPPEKE